MAPNQKSNSGSSLGITALILGLSAIFTIFLFKGMLSVLLGIIGIILASTGIGQARENDEDTGIIYTGLTVSIVGTAIALLWFFMVPGIIQPAKQRIEEFRKVENVRKRIKKHIEDVVVTKDEIKEAADELENAVESLGRNLEDVLIDLEAEIDNGKQRIEIRINDSNIIKITRQTEKTIRDIVDEVIEVLPDSIEIKIE